MRRPAIFLGAEDTRGCLLASPVCSPCTSCCRIAALACCFASSALACSSLLRGGDGGEVGTVRSTSCQADSDAVRSKSCQTDSDAVRGQHRARAPQSTRASPAALCAGQRAAVWLTLPLSMCRVSGNMCMKMSSAEFTHEVWAGTGVCAFQIIHPFEQFHPIICRT